MIWLACLVVAGIAVLLWFLGRQTNNDTLKDAGFIVGVLNTPLLAFLLRASLVLMLALGFLAFRPSSVGAWNYYTWKDASYSCGSATTCRITFFINGGSDRVDWVTVTIMTYCSYGAEPVTLRNGYTPQNTYVRDIWVGIGCHTSYLEVHSYDPQYSYLMTVEPIV